MPKSSLGPGHKVNVHIVCVVQGSSRRRTISACCTSRGCAVVGAALNAAPQRGATARAAQERWGALRGQALACKRALTDAFRPACGRRWLMSVEGNLCEAGMLGVKRTRADADLLCHLGGHEFLKDGEDKGKEPRRMNKDSLPKKLRIVDFRQLTGVALDLAEARIDRAQAHASHVYDANHFGEDARVPGRLITPEVEGDAHLFIDTGEAHHEADLSRTGQVCCRRSVL